MRYSIVLVSLAALAIAAPVETSNMKQAADSEYGSYGKYSDYGGYPESVDKVAKMMVHGNMKREMAVNAHQAADESYGAYGRYGKYSSYGDYPGDVEEQAAKAEMAKMTQ